MPASTLPEPPSERSGIGIPPELEAILMRCLEKAPDAPFAALPTPSREDGAGSTAGTDTTLAVDIGDRVTSGCPAARSSPYATACIPSERDYVSPTSPRSLRSLSSDD